MDKQDNSYKSEDKKTVLEKLEQAFGNISVACKATNISRQTYYRWLEEDEEFAEACELIYKVAPTCEGDFVKSKLMTLINNEVPSAIIFYCKTKLKHEGFAENVEWTGQLSGTIKTKTDIDYDKLSDKELETIEGLLKKAKKEKE